MQQSIINSFLENQLHHKEKIRAIQLVLLVGILLTIVKFVAYYLTFSAAILTDALESIINVVASFFALYSVHFASKSKDTDHPYGHGKIENISAGFEGGLILLAGILIMYEAVLNVLLHHTVQRANAGLLIILASALVMFFLGKFISEKGKKYHSLSMQADGKHLLTDVYTSIGLVIGLGLIWLTKLNWIDSVLAIFYSSLIIYTGYKLIRQSLDGLMDKIDFETMAEIVVVLNNNREKEWIDIHNMRIQKFGSHLHIDCHVTLPWYEDLAFTHLQMESIADLLNAHFENRAEFFIHPDPCKPTACKLCQVSDCKERKHSFDKKMEWTMENILENKSHGL